jgi:hypothetical protein
MKKAFLFILPLLTSAILLSSYSGNNLRYPGGAPAGYTGSPGDGKDCTDCHGGSSTPVTGWITSDVGPEGYIPGTTYNITLTVSGSGDKGFEVSPQDDAGNFYGTLIAGSGSKLVGNNHYITQTSSSSSNPKVWNFQWVAPEAGSGMVTMYGAFALNKSVTRTSTLAIPENTSVFISEEEIPGVEIFPVPADQHTRITFDLTGGQHGKLVVYDTGGKEAALVAQGFFDSGSHQYTAKTGSMKNGVYFIRFEGEKLNFTRKVLVAH